MARGRQFDWRKASIFSPRALCTCDSKRLCTGSLYVVNQGREINDKMDVQTGQAGEGVLGVCVHGETLIK